MFERYTEKARRAIFFARYEASQYGSKTIETEHLLLGLLREDRALTRKVLGEKGSAQSLRDEIESRITRGERISTSVDVPLSAECTRILIMAAEESERLAQKHVGTEHLLLGILREDDCFAGRLLTERGLTLAWLREELASPSDDPQKTEEIVSVMRLAAAWGTGQASEFARMFAADGQFVDPRGDLWIGPAHINEAAKRVFGAPGWAKTQGKIEDVQFVGSKAAMVTLVWEGAAAEKLEKANPGCVRMTVILTQKPDGWTIARVQATGLQPQSRSAAV